MRESTGTKKGKIIFLVILLIAAAASAALLFLSRLERQAEVVPENAGTAVTREEAEEKAAIYYNGHKYVPNQELSTLLIMGIDDASLSDAEEGVRSPSQADFILLAVFDPGTASCRMIQINRDSMCDIPLIDSSGKNIGSRKEQIALSHTYGSSQAQRCENVVKAVSGLLYGIPVDNYFAITMDGIPILNDLVGGVTVTIEDDFSGVDDSLIKGETVTLTADNVEHYVRARYRMTDDSSNIARMRRQRTYMSGLFQKLAEKNKSDSGFFLQAYDAISGSMVSDCTVSQMSDYADLLADYTLSEIVSPEGESVQGETYMEFYIDEEALRQLVIETFYRMVES